MARPCPIGQSIVEAQAGTVGEHDRRDVDVPVDELLTYQCESCLAGTARRHRVAEFLHHQLGGVVVAVAEHLGDHRRHRRRVDRGHFDGVNRCRSVLSAVAHCDASGLEEERELACCCLVGVVAAQRVAEDARVVGHQRVVRAAFETSDAVAPAWSEVLVVVAASVADNGTANSGDARSDDLVGQCVERRRRRHGVSFEVRRWIPVRRQQGIPPSDEVPLPDRRCVDRSAARQPKQPHTNGR